MNIEQLKLVVENYGVEKHLETINIEDVEGITDDAIDEWYAMISYYREFKQHRDYFENLIGMNDG
jgi:hypothetical protein